jgi:hypothetical protein
MSKDAYTLSNLLLLLCPPRTVQRWITKQQKDPVANLLKQFTGFVDNGEIDQCVLYAPTFEGANLFASALRVVGWEVTISQNEKIWTLLVKPAQPDTRPCWPRD